MKQIEPTFLQVEETTVLLNDLIDLVMVANSEASYRRRGVTKATLKDIDRAVTKLFIQLVGRKPTKAELEKITN